MNVDFTRYPCAVCGKRIFSNENAMACPKCRTVMHKTCKDKVTKCPNPHCDWKTSETAQTTVAEDNKIAADAVMMTKLGLTELQNPIDVISVRKIVADLAGTGVLDSGYSFELINNGAEKVQAYYQRAMVEQNWIIIRQLDRLNSSIEKLIEK